MVVAKYNYHIFGYSANTNTCGRLPRYIISLHSTVDWRLTSPFCQVLRFILSDVFKFISESHSLFRAFWYKVPRPVVMIYFFKIIIIRIQKKKSIVYMRIKEIKQNE